MDATPGWYQDPQSRPDRPTIRWWDGQVWTEHVATRLAPTARTPDGARLASQWVRLGARLIDGLILTVVQLVLLVPLLPRMTAAYSDFLDDADAAMRTGQPVDPFALYTDPRFWQSYLIMIGFGLLAGAVYVIGFLRAKSATPGKLLLGLRVRGWEQAGRLSWRTCFLRFGGEILPAILSCGLYFWVDALWCLFDGRRQTLHDKIASTVVVEKGSDPPAVAP